MKKIIYDNDWNKQVVELDLSSDDRRIITDWFLTLTIIETISSEDVASAHILFHKATETYLPKVTSLLISHGLI